MWKSFVSIPGLEFILSLSGFLPLAPSFPKLAQEGAQRNQDMANGVFQAYFCGRHRAALQRSCSSSWAFISLCCVQEQHRQRLGGSRSSSGSSAQSMAGHGTETSSAASAALSLGRDQLLGKPQPGIWFGRQWDVVAPPEPPGSLKRGCWCWWKRFITAVDFSFFYALGLYLHIFISHFSDPWRSIAHCNTININSNHILVCWRQKVPSCSFRDCWALIDFYIIPVKCSWFHCERELMHRE